MKLCNFLPLTLSTLALLLPVSGQRRGSPRISTRLAHTVCGQWSEFTRSSVLQQPIKAAPLTLKNGQGGFPCGWIDWRLAPSHPDTYKTCRQIQELSNGRVIGGQDAKPNQFPFIVSVGFGGNHSCGGSIINENWILTARHCQFGLRGPLNTVVAGEHDRRVSEGTEQIRNISLWLPPPKPFNASTKPEYDLAMVKVDPPFIFNEYVQPLGLPAPISDGEPEEMMTLIGWGSTIRGERVFTLSDILQVTEVPIIPREKCRQLIKKLGIRKTLYSSEMCAGHDDGRSNSCGGDSGGPLVTNNNGSFTIQGTVVGGFAGHSCSVAGYPNLYTRLSFPYFLEYIAKSIAEN